MFRVLLFSMISATILTAAPPPQPFRRSRVFEPNRGQPPAQVKWLARGPGYQIFFTGDGVTMRMPEHTAHASGPSGYSTLHMTLPGSRTWNKIEGLNPTGGISNYVRGKDAQNSLTQIPNYARISVANVYDGVDLIFYSRGGDLEYDIVIHPNARPQSIRLAFEGQRRMRVDEKSGDLVLVTPAGSELHQALPKVYQQTGEQHTEIAGRYQMLSDKQVAFRLAPYDHTRALVIDPVVSFTRFLSGSDWDQALAVAVDGAGNSYVTGVTYSGDFPLVNPWISKWSACEADFLGFCNFGDSFVTKLAPDGSILWSTFWNVGWGYGIAVDSTGVVIAGQAVPGEESGDFTFGGKDAFVVKFTLNTGVAMFDRFYYGSDVDGATSVAFDSQHNIWVAGYTRSNDFDGKAGARLGGQDVFVAKMSPSGVALFSQTFGSDGLDIANALAVDPADQPWVTGQTCGTGWPNFGGPIHQANGCAVFVMQLDTTGHTRMSMVMAGSSKGDAGLGILPNGSNAAYVTGYTHAANFPTTPGAFITSTTATGSQAFLTMIDSSTGIGHIVRSTLLGNDGDTEGYALASADPRAVYVAGSTSSVQFPGAPPLAPNPTAGFVSKFSFDLSRLEYTKLLGADAFGVAVRNSTDTPPVPEIYVAGDRYTAGSSLTNLDAFVVKLREDPTYFQLVNFWKPDQAINIEGGTAVSSPFGQGWWSADWQLVYQLPLFGDPGGQSVFWIQNRWKPNEYLNVESGTIQSTPIGPGWLSARWTFEQVPGTGLYLIRNVWQRNEYLNIESGALTAGPIQPGWYSARWTIQPAF